MLAFSVVSLFLLFLVYGLQCFVLDYFLISVLSPACWGFVAIDGLLLLYILASYNLDYAASKGGVQWLLYSWNTLAKIVLFYWVVLGRRDINAGLVGSIGIYVVFFFIPVLYLILSARASQQLHGPLSLSSITVESMLHADMVLHVIVDHIDLVTAFKYCDLPTTVRRQSPWIVTFVGVIIVLGLFMHGYSFPTAATNVAWQQSSSTLNTAAAVGGSGVGGSPSESTAKAPPTAAATAAANTTVTTGGNGGQSSGVEGPGVNNNGTTSGTGGNVMSGSTLISDIPNKKMISGPTILPSNATGDVYLTRKHAALVGMLCVDLPLLFARTFLWVNFPRNPGFSPFLVKNIIFLPIQVFRINQCRLAEKERAKSSQRAAFHRDERLAQALAESMISLDKRGTTATSPKNPVCSPQYSTFPEDPQTMTTAGGLRRRNRRGEPASSTNNIEQNNSFHNEQFASRGAVDHFFSSLQQPQQPQGGGPGGLGNNTREVPGSTTAGDFVSRDPQPGWESEQGMSPGRGQHILPAATSARFNQFGLSPNTAITAAATPNNNNNAQPSTKASNRIRAAIRELRSIREVPVRGLSFWKLLTKIFHCARVGGRHGLATILDDGFVLSYWKQIRLALPLMLVCLAQLAIVLATKEQPKHPSPVNLLKIEWHTWNEVPIDLRVSGIVVIANFLLMLLLWVGTAPFLDCVYVSLMWAVRLAAFYFICSTSRDTGMLEFRDKWHISFNTAPILQWGFALVPALRLLDALFPIQSALLGRKYMYFVVPAPNRSMEEALLATVSTFGASERALLSNQARAREDEFGWVTTSSILVFLNVRRSIAPISMGELLIGPDVIKSVRLMDMMVLRNWMELGMLGMVFVTFLAIHWDLLALSVFATRLLMGAIYSIFAQAVRLLALRRYEIKIIFEEIATSWENTASDGFASSLMPSNGGTGPNSLTALVDGKAVIVEDGRHTATNSAINGNNTSRIAKRRKRFLSLLDIVEKYERQGFFTSPGDLIPSFL